MTSLPEAALDLYGLAPGEFVGARNALVKSLKREKRTEDAAAVAALRRPSVADHAINAAARADAQLAAVWAAAVVSVSDEQSAAIGGGWRTNLRGRHGGAARGDARAGRRGRRRARQRVQAQRGARRAACRNDATGRGDGRRGHPRRRRPDRRAVRRCTGPAGGGRPRAAPRTGCGATGDRAEPPTPEESVDESADEEADEVAAAAAERVRVAEEAVALADAARDAAEADERAARSGARRGARSPDGGCGSRQGGGRRARQGAQGRCAVVVLGVPAAAESQPRAGVAAAHRSPSRAPECQVHQIGRPRLQCAPPTPSGSTRRARDRASRSGLDAHCRATGAIRRPEPPRDGPAAVGAAEALGDGCRGRRRRAVDQPSRPVDPGRALAGQVYRIRHLRLQSACPTPVRSRDVVADAVGCASRWWDGFLTASPGQAPPGSTPAWGDLPMCAPSVRRTIAVSATGTAGGDDDQGVDRMPKYVIERDMPGAGNLTADELRAASCVSNEVLATMAPGRSGWRATSPTTSCSACTSPTTPRRCASTGRRAASR